MFTLKKLIYPSCNGLFQNHNIKKQVIVGLRLTASKREENSVVLQLAYHVHPDNPPSEFSNSTPVVILHGLLGSKNNWNSMAKAISKQVNRKVYTVDVRNHGESPHTDEFSYELMVSDLVKFLVDRKMPKASLIGHSLGGRVCMMLALMYPRMVESLVVVDISPIGQSPNMLQLPELFRSIKELDLHPDLTLSEARKRASQQLKDKKMDDGLISFILTNLIENNIETLNDRKCNWRWKFNLDSIIKNFIPEVCRFPFLGSHFEKETLFVAGGLSDYVRPEDESKIKKMFPASKFVYINGAGHWVHAENPNEFLKVVSNFLNKDH